ncbi:MAG: DUF6786 family protein [bacterium]|nr:hypothetical protein [Candidatus Sumerlaeota bacterium]
MRNRHAVGIAIISAAASLLLSLSVADAAPRQKSAPHADLTFKSDLEFLQKHGEVIVLSDDKGQAQVAVSPGMQGRVMTSSAGGPEGTSYGWINRELIAPGKLRQHINAFGGEDRFWLGPEGGQYAIFFAKGAPFNLDHWFTPAAVDTEPFDVVAKNPASALFRKHIELTNYSGAKFSVDVNREVRLVAPADAWKHLGVNETTGVKMVAYESVNKITNGGKEPWKKETGLLSVWILGMFNPSPSTTIVIPIKGGPESELGKPVNSDYFGTVPPGRLIVKNDVVYFKGDGKYRSKIGINPKRGKPVMGSYDAGNKVLTIVQYTLPAGPAPYVNSQWKLQDNPYEGDAINSYNDGPPKPGEKPLGPFYELESSSPAAALEAGKTLEHVHRTIHLQGSEKELDAIARATLGAGIGDIKKAFAK